MRPLAACRAGEGRLLAERAIAGDAVAAHSGGGRRPERSVTVNLAESPLGWLLARGMIDDRQFDAGEKLRVDWERANLSPSITMQPSEGLPEHPPPWIRKPERPHMLLEASGYRS